ncbi:MAG: tRNA 5-methoxyuridine(34)/uridine 5-oxyacetic acid(34) synthase CmoB [Ignavibacteria bacterium]|nr:MAG: tRNA 5-methoxyuridine(34)/uridine 5-oxyacetic acid(34) synthase CmoB [Ignavibacteria bacterium]
MIDVNKLNKKLNRFSINIPPDKIEEYCKAIIKHGDYNKFISYLESLPDIVAKDITLNSNEVTAVAANELTVDEKENLEKTLKMFCPWRKGPFNLFGIHIDSEWRSDMKWSRVEKHLPDLNNKLILDVGCGNGYYAFRMIGKGAKFVLGLEPYLLSIVQFKAINKFIKSEKIEIIPAKLEALTPNLQCFDVVFSMGVLYHSKSPFDHLEELKKALAPHGTLVLETLVIEGDENNVLVPLDRYAKMRNVWFIPSAPTLSQWLKRAGFSSVEMVDETKTTTEEQRVTDWMQWESLNEFLDPVDKNKTIEGYPAPRRAIFICKK